MATYQHDLSFEILKRTREQIGDNYTSAQYLKTLDFFLWKALTPIIKACPELFQNYVAKVVAQQSLRNSKMTSDERGELPGRFMNLLLATDKVEAAQSMYINRGILFAFLSIFINLSKSYFSLVGKPEHPNLRRRIMHTQVMMNTERKLGVKPGTNLHSVILEVRHWTREASTFKNAIVEKYTRMTINTARQTYIECHHKMPLGDIISVYMLTLSKAIDRCDSRRGVLTTFIQNWFRGARSTVMGMVNADSPNMSYEGIIEDSDDSVFGSVAFDDTYGAMQELSELAKGIDREGLVRVSLGIPDFITVRHRELLNLLKDDGSE